MAEARIIDGRPIAQALTQRVGEEVARLVAERGLKPGLAVILVGDDPASQIYVRSKGEQSRAAGMRSETYRLPADTPEAEVVELVRRLNADPTIHGFLVQLPMPQHINEQRVIEAIDPDKDVDGLTVANAGRRANGLPALTPATPLGCMIMLSESVGNVAGARALVVGRSVLVGRPMAQLLLAADCTVTMAHSKSRDLPGLCREADILVAAIGRPQMIRGDWIK